MMSRCFAVIILFAAMTTAHAQVVDEATGMRLGKSTVQGCLKEFQKANNLSLEHIGLCVMKGCADYMVAQGDADRAAAERYCLNAVVQ